MLENTLDVLSDNLFLLLTKEKCKRKGLLVKKHSEHLEKLGDFSFPNTTKSWHGFLDAEKFSGDPHGTLLSHVNQTPEDLISESKSWLLPVNNVKVMKERVHVFLCRPVAISVGLSKGLQNTQCISKKLSEFSAPVHLDPLCEDANDITSLRLHQLTKSIQNLYALSEECRAKSPKVFITSKSSSKIDEGVMILCGTVLNAQSGAKETNLSADDFIKLRQNEMTLIAQHKYGVRVSTDSKWKEFISHLGESAVIFELLQTKPSGAVKINFDHSAAGSSKGASFILYNCARLETILRTYNEKVDGGSYPPLPDLESIDFSLLTQEDEWILVFNFILGLPNLLENCVEINEKNCEFRPHHVCSFLSSMVRVFSQYYRKIRILTEPRKHLLPVMFARIHMLKVLNESLKMCLSILNIKSVTQMYMTSFIGKKCQNVI